MFLKNLWYFAMPGRDLKRGAMTAKQLLGEPLLIARDDDGVPFALRDICPHRGIPLSHGAFDGKEVECCYHGWRFGGDGRCTAIPSLVPGQKFNIERVKVARYPCREVQGNIWIYFGDETKVHNAIYWTQPWLTPLKPFLAPFARAFLKQDRDVVVMQQEGLRHNPHLMLINDADVQAKWYYQLKDAWQKAGADGQPFKNPVKAQELRWRS